MLIVVLILQACADQNLPPLNTGIPRNQYQSIAIRVVPYEHSAATFPVPAKGALEGTSKGARAGTAGFLGGCALGSLSTAGVLFLACLALTPVAAGAGAIAGGFTSYSEMEVTRATNALKVELKKATPAEDLAQAIVRKFRETERVRREARTLVTSEANLPNAELSRLGFDAVLEVEIVRLDLTVYGAFDPDAAVMMMVHTSLQDTTQSSASLPLSWTYQGPRHGYFELANGNALLLRKVLDQSYDETAMLIIDDLFSGSRPD